MGFCVDVLVWVWVGLFRAGFGSVCICYVP